MKALEGIGLVLSVMVVVSTLFGWIRLCCLDEQAARVKYIQETGSVIVRIVEEIKR